jgi:threonine dehydrogenase-like Zn-dependent dehydrogenase
MYHAAAMTRPHTLEIQSKPDISLFPNEVLIRMAYAGVCGTDIAIYSGDYQVPLPLVLGHEFSGIVEAVGSQEDAFMLGKPVVGEINNTCVAYRKKELCPACKKGLTNHCLTRTTLGIFNYDGVFAEYIKLPAGSIHLIPSSLSLKRAVLVEPLAAAFRTFEMAELHPEDTVVVIGTGRLGKFVLAVAAKARAKTVAVVRNPANIETAKAWGAQKVFCTSKEDAVKAVLEMTEGLGTDMVVEATGNPEGFSLAMQMVRPQGTLSLKTTCGLPAEGVDATRLVVNELRIQGSRCGPFPKALPFLAENQYPFDSLISEIFPLEKAAAAIEAAMTQSKVLIQGPAAL